VSCGRGRRGDPRRVPNVNVLDIEPRVAWSNAMRDRRIVQDEQAGAEPSAPTDFAQDKRAGRQAGQLASERSAAGGPPVAAAGAPGGVEPTRGQ
jgi:hypothetical protein